MGLTPKQEAFALAYVETGNAAEAYRRAYDVRAATTHSTIYSAAAHLMADPRIATRVQELQLQAVDMAMFTIKAALDEYEEARQLALTSENPSPAAAVAATNGKVKLFGLEAPSRSKHELVGKDDGPIQTEDVTRDADAFARRMADLAARHAASGTGETDTGSTGGA